MSMHLSAETPIKTVSRQAAALALAACLLSLLLAACGGSDSTPDGFKVYEDTEGRFSVLYPENWDVLQEPGTIVSFAEPQAEGVDRAYANVNAEAMEEPVNPAEYMDRVLPLMEEMLPEFQLLSSEEVTVNGVDGVRVNYSFSLQEENMTLLTYALVKDEHIYAFSGGAMTDRYQELEATFDTMFRNAKIN